MAEPARITVLWHRDCVEGKDLAAAVFRWFRGDPDDLGEAGRGLPVHYRCWPQDPPADPSPGLCADLSPGGSLKVAPGVSADARRIEIAVPLVDEHLVVDPDWRRYLSTEIKERAQLLVPVALGPAAYQLPFSISRLNYLRLDRAVDPDTWGWEQRSRIRKERLISLLTQVVARELLGPGAGERKPGQDAAPPRITVFISHAKVDGVHEAEALRSAILASGQMQAFYDESDLPIGYAFEQRLEDAAGPGGVAETQAMVAIYSDAYPSRPWCQRELRLARKPRRRAATGPGARCWRVKPLVVAASLNGAETRLLGEAGNAPLIAWDETRIGRIVDTLLREILLLRYNEERGLALLQADADAGADADPSRAGRHALNCIPDIYAAMEISRASARAGAGPVTELLIPPPGLPREDRELLGRLMSDGPLPIPITTFDEAELTRP